MNLIAVVAESIDHHPNWYNVYNQVEIQLNTHDIKTVSLKDLFLARAIDIASAKVSEIRPTRLNQKINIDFDELNHLKNLFEHKNHSEHK